MDDQDKLKAAIASGSDPWEVVGRFICYCDGISADADWRYDDKSHTMLDVFDPEPQNWKRIANKVKRALKRAGLEAVAKP